MARVPTYDELQVAPRGLPGPQQSGVSPDAFGYAARQQATEAAAIDKASDVGVNIAVKMQEREDTDMLLRAEVAFHDELLQFETEAKKRKGADAKGLTQETDAFFNDARKKYVEGLANDRQRQAFIQRITPVRQSTMRSISGFEEKERIGSLVEASEARTNIAVRTAAGNAHDWSIVDAERKEIERQALVLKAELRWSDARYEDYLASKLTPFHTQVMQQLTSKPELRTLAKKYFEKYEKDIPGDIRAELGKQATEATQKAAVMSAVDEVVTASKIEKDRRAPIQLNTMEGALRERFKDDPEGYALASAQLRSRVAAVKDERAQQTNALEADVSTLLINKVPPLKVLDSPEMKRLQEADPEAGNKWRLHLNKEAEHATTRALAMANLADVQERRKLNAMIVADQMLVRRNYDTWVRSHDPEYLASLTEPQARLLRDEIGTTEGAQAYARWAQFKNKPQKVFEAKLDNDMFQRVAIMNGVPINEKNKSEADKDRIVFLKAHVESVLADAANRSKRDLTPEEKEKLVTKAVTDKVMLPGWFGSDLRATAQPVGAVLPREMADAYVDVPADLLADVFKRGGLPPPSAAAMRVKLADVPPTERVKIESALKNRGIPVSQSLVAAMWLGEKARQDRQKALDDAAKARGTSGQVGVSPANIPR